MRVGDIQHGEQSVAIRQRNAGIFQRPPIGEDRTASGLAPVKRRCPDHITHCLGPVRFFEPCRDPLEQDLDARMSVKEAVVEPPIRRKAPVPQLHPTIGGEYRNRFKQTVECRRAGPQQGVAGGRQPELLGPVFGDEQQTAIGQGLGNDPQMRAVGQSPRLFLRLAGHEPASPFAPPDREIARFGYTPGIAGNFQQPFERRRIEHHRRPQREQPLERLIGESQLALGVELRHPGRQLIEHRALRLAEGPEIAGQFFHVFNVDRVTGDPFLAQRQVAHPQRAALAVDRGRDHPLDRHLAGCGLTRDLRRGQPVDHFDQLDARRHDRFCALARDGLDVSGVDQPQVAIEAAKPHRHRRGLDQSDQRRKIAPGVRGLGPQLDQFALAVAEVEHPDQRGTARRHLRIGQMTAQGEAALRAARGDDHAKRRSSFLRAADRLGQLGQLLAGQAPFAAIEFGKELRDRIEPQPSGELGRGFDLAVSPDQQRKCRRFIDHPRQPPGMTLSRLNPARLGLRCQNRPASRQRPRCQQQPDQDECGL